jgi:hypothetical protein
MTHVSSAAARCFFTSIALAAAVVSSATLARAGIPECGGIRLEDVASCEIRGSLDCEASCSELGVFKKACATRLHSVCRSECTLSAQPTCTDECTVQCESDCDRGINITCIHNCFGECVGSCDTTCEGAEDAEQCRASCEATCDGECDIQCEPVVDASCYQHCIECCHGSCGAQANMDCQTTCQDQEFETCEYEFKADCDAECSGDGALFCDGEYVLGGDDLVPCAQALVAQGISALDFDAEGEVDADATGSAGCQFDASGPASGWPGWLLTALGLSLTRRRTRRSRRASRFRG